MRSPESTDELTDRMKMDERTKNKKIPKKLLKKKIFHSSARLTENLA